jgi:hypothetical protein
MIPNEYILTIGILLVGIIFFLSAQTYIMSSSEETFEHSIKGVAERLSSIAKRISTESSYARYCLNISLSDLKVEEGYMIFTQKGNTFTLPVPKETKNVDLKEIAHLCFVHTPEGEIEIYGEPIVCNMNLLCEPEECGGCCPDCSATDCIGDGICEKCIGENCENSVDCVCNGSTCCPSDPSSDDFGCINESRLNLSKGEECFCDVECNISANLTCNQVFPGFTNYTNACCESGYGWNGSECIPLDTFDVFIVPVQIDDQATYSTVASEFKNHFLSVSPFKECKNKNNLVKFWIINISDCPNEAASSCLDHCSDCITIGRNCARRMEGILGVTYDKFAVLTKGGGWNGGCACNIPCDGASSSLLSCNSNLCVPSHEIGHDLGLGHIDCGVACHACMSGNPNCPDCSLPLAEKASFIMDYCNPMQKYGPAGYDFLNTSFIGIPPNAAGLEKWLKGCIR